MTKPLVLLPLLLLGCDSDIVISKERTDSDGDGYAVEVDCDDAHATVNPDAPERCDGLDNDCDGEVDEGADDAPVWYLDGDGDGYGDEAIEACEQPDGAVTVDGDCDDASADVSPGEAEVCDGLDNDCDGETDEDAVDAGLWYHDADSDGFGAGEPSLACAPEAGQTDVAGDCDDDDGAVFPGAEESCSEDVDANCDGSTLYDDVDGDGVPACEDCDDGAADVYPGAVEVCDEVDQDCDGAVDEGVTETWYEDADGDGFGHASSTIEACAPPTGYGADASDCDDADRTVYPGAVELCDDLDQDCDGVADEDAIDAGDWYTDGDGDGYGDADRSVRACEAPAGTLADGGDCDDDVASIHPGATEICDDLDQDCDGVADDDAVDAETWYADSDSDGYGDGSRAVEACEAPSGYVSDSTDCNDGSSSISPAATEKCDAANTDEDCDGLADDADSAATGKTRWYRDADGDTAGDPSTSTTACDLPSGYVASSTDCDDGDGTVNPAATEVCDAFGVDEDCDDLVNDDDPSVSGRVDWFVDGDGDGYGGASTVAACDRPSGATATSTDCDDSVASIHPGGAEICDSANTDEDCDGYADDLDASATGQSTWYLDADGDGYGLSTSTVSRCDKPSGYVAISTDCDDDESDAFPGNTEVCEDGIDQDCSGDDQTCPLVGALDPDSGYDVRITGDVASNYLGYAMERGDFDGDGLGDLVIGAPSARYSSASYGGVMYGYYGPFTSGEQSATDHDSFLYYNNTSTYTRTFAMVSANLGDLNSDGNDDLIVRLSNGSPVAWYLFYSGDTGDLLASTAKDASFSCTWAAPGGDFSSTTGTDEWFCGDASYSSETGKVTVYSGTSASSSTVIVGEGSKDSSGYRVAGGGDVNGDGYDDLWDAAPNQSEVKGYDGVVYLVYAPVSGTTSLADADQKIRGDDTLDNMGEMLVMAGDMDGDGTDDLLTGSIEVDDGGTSSGAIYLITEPSTGTVSSVASASLIGDESNLYLSQTRPSTGDVDGDGALDLLVGVPVKDAGGSNRGQVYLYYGPVSGSLSLDGADATWTGGSDDDELGSSVMVIPDNSGDGLPEIAMGAQFFDGDTTDCGAVWIWYGR